MVSIEGERKICESDTGGLVLTSHKVRFEARELGRAHIISIMLEELVSCEIHYSSQIMFIVLAVLSVIAGAILSTTEIEAGIYLGLGAALIFIFLYLGSRRLSLSLASPGAKIHVKLNPRRGLATGREFIEEIEHAKNARYMQLLNTG